MANPEKSQSFGDKVKEAGKNVLIGGAIIGAIIYIIGAIAAL